MASNNDKQANDLCNVCGTHLHASNKKSQCQICLKWHHKVCISTTDGILFCISCIRNNLPFLCLDNGDFLKEIEITYK